MITVSYNGPEVISNMLTQLSNLNPGTGIINTEIVMQGYQTLHPLMVNRIHTQGLAADGSAIGSILVRTGQLRDGFEAMPDGLGWADDTLGQRAIQLEQKYGKAIWSPTVEETTAVITTAQNIMNDAFPGE